MKCKYCNSKSEIYVDYARMSLCKNCFLNFIEDKVKRTILKYQMIREKDKVVVAVSGGKDSSSLLALLKKLAVKQKIPNFEMIALHINLGIGEYSENCEKSVKKLCKLLNVELKIFDLKKELGFTIEDVEKVRFRRNVCAACGMVKRYVLNLFATRVNATKIATGHHLDDMLAVLWDAYLQADFQTIAKVEPVLATHSSLVARIKPLVELCEYETKAYAEFSNLPIASSQCKFGKGARLKRRKKLLDSIEKMKPSFKHTFWKTHLKRFLPHIKKIAEFPEIRKCKICGMPTSLEVCGVCKLRNLIQQSKQ